MLLAAVVAFGLAAVVLAWLVCSVLADSAARERAQRLSAYLESERDEWRDGDGR